MMWELATVAFSLSPAVVDPSTLPRRLPRPLLPAAISPSAAPDPPTGEHD
jgi:hypothetical protein